MNRTPIEWTDFSANPLKYRAAAGTVVWGCVHVSPGCQRCYAEALAKRYGKGGPFNLPTTSKLTPFLDEAELRRMLTYKPAAGKRCFVGDMTDIFGDWVERWMLAQLFGTMGLRYDVTWQVLTKRAARMRELLSDPTFRAEVAEWVEMLAMGDDGCDPLARTTDDLRANAPDVEGDDWPLRNVWLGVSCEDQQRAEERIPQLLKTPAAVRFVSAEPLLGPIQIERFLQSESEVRCCGQAGCEWCDGTGTASRRDLNWVILGFESGAGARPGDLAWLRSLIRQCQEADVAAFVKQLGALPFEYIDPNPANGWPGDLRAFRNSVTKMDAIAASQGRMVNTIANHEIRDLKGGDPAEWPEDVRVRQFPGQEAAHG